MLIDFIQHSINMDLNYFILNISDVISFRFSNQALFLPHTRVCCRSPLIPVRPNYSSGDILSGSINGSLPRSSGGLADNTGSAPNLTRISNGSYREISPDSGTQSWTNGWNNASYSVTIDFLYLS